MRKRALAAYIVGFLVGWSTPAYAQTDIFSNITQLLCRVANSLQGPVALAVGLIVLAGGGIAIAVGGRRSLGVVIWGLIGIAVAVGAATILQSAFGRGACQ